MDELTLYHKTRIVVTVTGLDSSFVMEIPVPDDREEEEYIDEFLEKLFCEEFRYNHQWDFE